MHVTVRRYEGVDETRREELAKKVNESLIPRLSRLPGFSGYYLIEAKDGVMTSVNLFDTSEHAGESTRVSSIGLRGEGSRRRYRTRPRSLWARSSRFKETALASSQQGPHQRQRRPAGLLCSATSAPPAGSSDERGVNLVS